MPTATGRRRGATWTVRRLGLRRPGRALILVLATAAGLVAASVLTPMPAPVPVSTAAVASVAPTGKPNVVVFVMDDARARDLQYMKQVRRELGNDGLTFTEAIAQNPICCPARAELMTGQLSHNNGVHTNEGTDHGGLAAMIDPDNTLGRWMHDAGYNTSYTGKYLNGYNEKHQFTDVFGPDGTPTGWDNWDPTLRGQTAYWHFVTKQDCPTLGDRACIDRAYRQRRYTTFVERDKTLALIDRFHQDDRPFFLFDSWAAPHKDTSVESSAGTTRKGYPKAPREYWKRSDAADFDRQIRSKPSYNEPDMSDKTSDMRGWGTADVTRHAKRNYLGRVAAIRAADEAMGQTIRHLKDVGEFDNTVFVLTADGGFLNGEHRLLYKKWEFSESLDIPLVISWPDGGVPRNVTTNRSAGLVDITATILAATGVRSRRTSVDGKSLLDTSATRKYQPTPMLIGSGRETARPGELGWAYRGIQWGRYIWTIHWGPRDRGLGEQFYDLKVDRYQINSQPNNPFYKRNIERTLKRYYLALRRCAGATCVPPARRPIPARDPDHDGVWTWYEKHVYHTNPHEPDHRAR